MKRFALTELQAHKMAKNGTLSKEVISDSILATNEHVTNCPRPISPDMALLFVIECDNKPEDNPEIDLVWGEV